MFVFSSLAMSGISSSSYLDCFVRWEVICHTAASLYGIDSRIWSKQLQAFLYSYHRDFFSQYVSLIFYLVHPCNCTYTTTALKTFRFISSEILDFHVIDYLSRAVKGITERILISVSVDEILLPSYVNRSTNFTEIPLKFLIIRTLLLKDIFLSEFLPNKIWYEFIL